MDEQTFETVLAKYSELIEEDLTLLGQQVTVFGRRMDLLFKDRFERKLIVELKAGAIKDQHIGQILAYEGMLLSADDPTIRVMLIGTRVPPNIRRALDHHGIAWKEMTVSMLLSYLRQRNDDELINRFPTEDRGESFTHSRITSPSVQNSNGAGRNGKIANHSKFQPPSGYSESLSVEQVRRLFANVYIEDAKEKRVYLEKAKTFKLWANYIAGLILDREAKRNSESDRYFRPKEIKEVLKRIMPFHYGKDGAKEGSLLTADVRSDSKYNLGYPCLEKREGSSLYRFIGFG